MLKHVGPQVQFDDLLVATTSPIGDWYCNMANLPRNESTESTSRHLKNTDTETLLPLF